MSGEIIIGIDFGTTFSGVSWAVNGGKKEVRLITKWPNPGASANQNQEKVPSIIAYNNNVPSKWGYSVSERDQSFRWIKILLESDSIYADKAEQVKKSNELLDQQKKQAVSVVADYLSKLWDHTMEHIARIQGASFREDYKLKVVMSVPAMWTPAAKEKTLQAARQAGLSDDICLVTEPEAAALAVLREKSEMQELQAGDCFVMCDAGGGTVDLISYEVQQHSPLVIKEVAIGTEGGLCGSAYLDMGFQKWVCQLIGQNQWNKMRDQSKRKAVSDFESLKQGFYAAGPDEYSIELRDIDDDAKIGIRDELLIVRKSAILTIFDGVCGQIKALVAQQVEQVKEKARKVKAILLVGGFGESSYLHDQLTAAYKGEGIKVLQANGAWSAICRGATLWGLEHSDHFEQIGEPNPQKTVVARLARYSYGIKCMQIFESSKHLLADGVFDYADNAWYAANQMEWLIKRGDEFEDGQTLASEMRASIAGIGSFWGAFSQAQRSFTHVLYYSVQSPPPQRGSADGVKKLCEVGWKVADSDIWLASSSRKGADGQSYRDVTFIVGILLGNADLAFAVVCGDKLQGAATAKYPDE